MRYLTTATGSQEEKTESVCEDPCTGLESQRDVSRRVKFSDDGSAPTAGWEIFVDVRHSFFGSYTSTIGLMTHCRIFLHFSVTEECRRVKSLQKRALVRDKRQCKDFRHPARPSRQLPAFSAKNPPLHDRGECPSTAVMSFLKRWVQILQSGPLLQEVRRNAIGQQCSRRPDMICKSSRHGWSARLPTSQRA